jgi:hypothetical protein
MGQIECKFSRNRRLKELEGNNRRCIHISKTGTEKINQFHYFQSLEASVAEVILGPPEVHESIERVKAF